MTGLYRIAVCCGPGLFLPLECAGRREAEARAYHRRCVSFLIDAGYTELAERLALLDPRGEKVPDPHLHLVAAE